MAKIGYIRVSTQEQNTARQDVKINCETCDRVFTEKISGKSADRPQLKAMMDYVREGDTVIVESYSRFSRNTRDLLELVSELDRKGVAFVSLKENVDTTTPQGPSLQGLHSLSGSRRYSARRKELQKQSAGTPN